MGRTLQRAGIAIAVVLLLAFLIVHFIKWHSERSLARETRTAATSVPAVDVVVVHGG